MSEPPDDRAQEYAQTIMRFVNLAAYVASPRMVANTRRLPLREHLIEQADAYLEVVRALKTCPDAPGNRSAIASEQHARKLRELCRQWTTPQNLPRCIQESAREFLAAAGISEPVDGWDAFEGWPEGQHMGVVSTAVSAQCRGPSTWDDYLALDQRDARELIDGNLTPVEPLDELHSHILARLHAYLVAWAEQVNAGYVLGPQDKLKIDEYSGVMPGLHFYRYTKVMEPYANCVRRCPNLVAEISTPIRDRLVHGTRVRLYASLAIPEYWILDFAERLLERLVLDENRYAIVEVRERDDIFRPDTFAALEIPLADLWKT